MDMAGFLLTIGVSLRRHRHSRQEVNRVHDALTAIRRDITEGRISGQSLVSLFNVVTNAGHEGDRVTLAEGRGVAERLAESAPPELVDDARRLLEHCDELLRNSNASSPQSEAGPARCPSCGRELPPHAIRCRGCGELFV